MDRLRRRAAYRRATESLKSDTGNPLTLEVAPATNQVEVNDLSKLLKRAIQVLPEAQKEVIDLAFFKGDESARNRREKAHLLGDGENSDSFGPAKNAQLPSADAKQDLRKIFEVNDQLSLPCLAASPSWGDFNPNVLQHIQELVKSKRTITTPMVDSRRRLINSSVPLSPNQHQCPVLSGLAVAQVRGPDHSATSTRRSVMRGSKR